MAKKPTTTSQPEPETTSQPEPETTSQPSQSESAAGFSEPDRAPAVELVAPEFEAEAEPEEGDQADQAPELPDGAMSRDEFFHKRWCGLFMMGNMGLSGALKLDPPLKALDVERRAMSRECSDRLYDQICRVDLLHFMLKSAGPTAELIGVLCLFGWQLQGDVRAELRERLADRVREARQARQADQAERERPFQAPRQAEQPHQAEQRAEGAVNFS